MRPMYSLLCCILALILSACHIDDTPEAIKEGSTEKISIDSSGISSIKDNEVKTFSFEKSIYEEDIESLFLEAYKKVADAKDSADTTLVETDKELYNLMNELNSEIAKVYISKEYPDLSGLYDMSSELRKENKAVMEAYLYLNNAHTDKFSLVEDKSMLKVLTVRQLEEDVNLYELIISIKSEFETTEGTYSGAGSDLIVHSIKTDEGYKIIRVFDTGGEYNLILNLIKLGELKTIDKYSVDKYRSDK